MPSKRVLGVIIVVTALVTSIIIAFGKEKSSATIDLASNLIVGQKISIPENPNWKDEIGQLDGKTQTLSEAERKPAEKEDETVTDTVSRSLMANYLALKQADQLDKESAQKLIDQAINYIENTSEPEKTITNLNIIEDSSVQAIANYGESLGQIAKKHSVLKTQQELNILVEILQNQDASRLGELDKVVDNYNKITVELIEVVVPKIFYKNHFDLVNSTNGMAVAIKKMKDIFNDPFSGIQALQAYQQNLITFSQAADTIISSIKKNNIPYKQGSGGYYLLYEI